MMPAAPCDRPADACEAYVPRARWHSKRLRYSPCRHLTHVCLSGLLAAIRCVRATLVVPDAVAAAGAGRGAAPPMVGGAGGAGAGGAVPLSAAELVSVPDHDHPLRRHGPGGFSCDLCRGGSGNRYKCDKGCNWGAFG